MQNYPVGKEFIYLIVEWNLLINLAGPFSILMVTCNMHLICLIYGVHSDQMLILVWVRFNYTADNVFLYGLVRCCEKAVKFTL